ncbi:hypothetical protein Lesp01_08260 [Lentzea sp. NBRC 102530]|nr:hypothetical protein Lesp01_08260 [Lentzea sp. NBRC 102530]
MTVAPTVPVTVPGTPMLAPMPAFASNPVLVDADTLLPQAEVSFRSNAALSCVPTSFASLSVAFIWTAPPLLACGLTRSGDVTKPPSIAGRLLRIEVGLRKFCSASRPGEPTFVIDGCSFAATSVNALPESLTTTASGTAFSTLVPHSASAGLTAGVVWGVSTSVLRSVGTCSVTLVPVFTVVDGFGLPLASLSVISYETGVLTVLEPSPDLMARASVVVFVVDCETAGVAMAALPPTEPYGPAATPAVTAPPTSLDVAMVFVVEDAAAAWKFLSTLVSASAVTSVVASARISARMFASNHLPSSCTWKLRPVSRNVSKSFSRAALMRAWSFGFRVSMLPTTASAPLTSTGVIEPSALLSWKKLGRFVPGTWPTGCGAVVVIGMAGLGFGGAGRVWTSASVSVSVSTSMSAGADRVSVSGFGGAGRVSASMSTSPSPSRVESSPSRVESRSPGPVGPSLISLGRGGFSGSCGVNLVLPLSFGCASTWIAVAGSNVGGCQFSISSSFFFDMPGLISGLGSKNGSTVVVAPFGPWIVIGRPMSVASSLAASTSACASLAFSAFCSALFSASYRAFSASDSGWWSGSSMLLSTSTSPLPGWYFGSMGSGVSGPGSSSELTRWPFSSRCCWLKSAIWSTIPGVDVQPVSTAPARRSVADLTSVMAGSATIASCTALKMPSGRGSPAYGSAPCWSVPNWRVTVLGLVDIARFSNAAIFSRFAAGSMPMLPWPETGVETAGLSLFLFGSPRNFLSPAEGFQPPCGSAFFLWTPEFSSNS